MLTQKHNPPRKDAFHSFRHDHARLAKRKKILFVAIFLACILLLLRTPAEGYLSSALHTVLRPFYGIRLFVVDMFSDYTYLLSTKRSLVEENLRLKDALDAGLVANTSREALRIENDELKRVFYRDPSRHLMLARVLASPGEIPYDTILIDIGAQEGLTDGLRVFYDGDIAIGEVTQTYGHSALVTLYSSHGNELSARIGATGTPVVASGMGGGSFRIILPKGIGVERGEMVEIPDLAPTYLGAVEAVVRSEQSSLQEIYVRFPFSVSGLRFVYLEVLPPENTDSNSP